MAIGNPRSSETDGEIAAPQSQHGCCPACGDSLAAPSLEAPDRNYDLPGKFTVACCESCGIGVTLPQVEEAQLESFYPATYGTYEGLMTGVLGLASRAVQGLQSWQSLRTAPLERLARLPAGRLLEVGCGRADLGSWFVRRGWVVIGIEPSAQACAVARGRGVQARTGTFASLQIEPGAYDAVVFRHSLEHVADPVDNLRRAHDALRDDGIAIVSVPNFGGWQSRAFGRHWFMLDLPRHRFHFTAGALQAMFARAGFQSVEICTSSSSVGLPGSVQFRLAGRCLIADGAKQMIAIGLCTAAKPLIRALDHWVGEGDTLHAIAYRR
jgi:SAM-dependent methyltransferase